MLQKGQAVAVGAFPVPQMGEVATGPSDTHLYPSVVIPASCLESCQPLYKLQSTEAAKVWELRDYQAQERAS